MSWQRLAWAGVMLALVVVQAMTGDLQSVEYIRVLLNEDMSARFGELRSELENSVQATIRFS